MPNNIDKLKIGGTTYNIHESKPAAEGGTDLSLVTTGEKYQWNNAGGGGTRIEYSETNPPASPTAGMIWLKQAPISLEEAKVLVLSTTASSLPTTVYDSNIKSDMIVLKSEIGSPSAQSNDLTVTTSTGSLTITGTLSASTTITLYLMRSR